MMTLRILIAILLLASTAWAHTPIGMQKWQIDDTTFTMQFGGAPQNYPSVSAWNPIENDFHVNGGGIFESSNRLLKTFVDSLGDVVVTYTRNETDYTVVQQPHSLKFFRKTDSAWINIDNTPNFNNISFDGNTIRWGNMYPGVNYKVILSNGKVENRYEFKSVFLDSAVVLLDQRPDSADIYLANVMTFTLSASIDGHDIPLGTIPKRVLKRFGGIVFQIGKTTLQGFPGADTLNVPVWQRYIFIGDQLYVLEFVKMSHIKRIHEAYPTATLWHNTDFTIANDTDTEDTNLRENVPNGNYGSLFPLIVQAVTDEAYKIIQRYLNVRDSIGEGATISFAACSLYCSTANGDTGDVYIYPMWKVNWPEDEATWNRWNDDLAYEWGTEGALCDKDAGVFNDYDDGACNNAHADKKETAEDSVIDVTVGWHGWEVTGSAQDFYDADLPWSYIYEQGATAGDDKFSPKEGGFQPKLVITYTTDGAAAPSPRRRKILLGGK